MLIWIIVAGLTIASLAAVVWPLLREKGPAARRADFDVAISRDQLKEVDRDVARGVLSDADGENMRREVSRRLLAADDERKAQASGGSAGSRRLAAMVAIVAVPLLSVGVYLQNGSPYMADRPLSTRLAKPVDKDNMSELVARVEQTLREQPDNLQGWSVIAPVYLRMRRFGDAANAYRRQLDIAGPDAGVLTALGEALVLQQDGLVPSEARKAFSHALALEPSALTARYFLALAAAQDGRTDEAVAGWRKILADAPSDLPWIGVVKQQIAMAAGHGTTSAESEEQMAAGKPPASSQGASSQDTMAGVKAPALSKEQMAGAAEMTAQDQQTMIEGMVKRLETRLNDEGGAVEEWLRLARAQTILGRGKDATITLARARKIYQSNAEDVARINAMGAELGLSETQ